MDPIEESEPLVPVVTAPKSITTGKKRKTPQEQIENEGGRFSFPRNISSYVCFLTESRKSSSSTAVSRNVFYVLASFDGGPKMLFKPGLRKILMLANDPVFACGEWRDNLGSFILLLYCEEGYM